MSEFHCSQNDKNFSSQEDFSRQDDALRQENSQEQSPAGGSIPAAVEVVFLEALSGDALRVGLPASEAHAPERSGTATGRVPAVVYLWGIQAPRPGQPFGTEATVAASRICEGKRLRVAARSAGPEGRITGSVVAEETGSPGEDTTEKGNAGKGSGGNQDVGRALIRLGLAWQDQRGPSSARLRSLEQEARREEVGLWQQEAPTPPWAWRE
ncbi:thermonuclease family protein [Salinibacter ruber]|uniref:Endonuclease YncB(Thermonuclease family) n=1 Tax=Salinibacter ruber TaxID=146919 RepID=A0A9X2UPR3_9BACT|nr:thermonuclease family protein [Salinibacter ruber]MCS3613489.1 endonuclease YncB(thermonuclease family) [Salinibacter ruber]MCS3616339.1 endonuclease YncB(thermonuclease family) [Salinibacter ruber]MCS3785367.1 endonuclease YncB(thermonuclease family) [Salinibacter ruber]MCS4038255.1 endonuclease YncB(thermonuclease family) [Salinibacter ruber]